jgi:alcohol dehydrogenase class IV
VAAFLDKVGLKIGLSRFGVDRAILPRLAEDALRYMGGAAAKTPGCSGKGCLVQLLEESF